MYKLLNLIHYYQSTAHIFSENRPAISEILLRSSSLFIGELVEKSRFYDLKIFFAHVVLEISQIFEPLLNILLIFF